MSKKSAHPTASHSSAPNRQKRFKVHPKSSTGERHSAIEEFRQTLGDRLEIEHAALVRQTELRAIADAPLRQLIEAQAEASRARHKLDRLFDAERKSLLKSFRGDALSGPRFDLQISPGIEVIAPPYDLQWHTALSQADKADGSFNVAALVGYEAAAVGVLVSSLVPATISFRPVVPFNYLWLNSAMQAPCSSRGGLGLLVYRNGESTPFLDRRRVLWDDHRDAYAPLGKDSGDGYFGTEFSPGDVLLQAEAGDTFRIWMWCWAIAHSVSTANKVALSSGYVACRMPFIVVDAGPPLPPIR